MFLSIVCLIFSMIWKYRLAYISERRKWLFGQHAHDSLLDFITCIYLLVGRKRVIWAGSLSHAGIGPAESPVTCSSQSLPRFLQLRYLKDSCSSLVPLFSINVAPVYFSARDFDGE
jgi:hypothetical protein